VRCQRLLTVLSLTLAAGLGLMALPAIAAIGTQVPLTQITAWGSQGSGNGQFNRAADVAVDLGSGNVYVAEVGNARVQRFTADGAFLGAFDKLGALPRSPSLERPAAIAVGGGNVYVQDTELGEIVRFSLTGTFLDRWSVPPQAQPPTGSGFSGVPDLAADAGGSVFVLTGSKTIQKYSSAGALLLSFDVGGTYNLGLAVGPTGDIVVTGLDGSTVRIAPPNASVSGFDASSSLGTTSGAIDSAGSIWITDPIAHKLLSFTPTGSLRASTGTGPGTPLFTGPGAVAASATPDIVYVVDANRIVKVGKAARLILTFDADANGEVDRTFTVSGPGATQTFTVDDDTDPTLSNTAVASGLALGTWHVDLPNTNVQVKTITCSNGVQTSDYAAHAVDVTLGVGETVTCNFYAEWIG